MTGCFVVGAASVRMATELSMTGAAPFMRICRLNPTAFTSLQSAALPASHKQRRFQVTTNQGIDVSTVRMQEIVPDAELTALRAQTEALLLAAGVMPEEKDNVAKA